MTKLAMQMPRDYVFPFQNEAIDVLRAAIKANSKDAHATYYLGNLLYDWRPEEETRMWEASVALDPSFAITHRNLAIAYMHQKSGAEIDKAIAEMKRPYQWSTSTRCTSPSWMNSTKKQVRLWKNVSLFSSRMPPW